MEHYIHVDVNVKTLFLVDKIIENFLKDVSVEKWRSFNTYLLRNTSFKTDKCDNTLWVFPGLRGVVLVNRDAKMRYIDIDWRQFPP